MNRRQLTSLDHRMIHVAKQRGRVRLDNGCEATLLCWKPRASNRKARVRFDSGTEATIDLARIIDVVTAA